jgi:hypothetical protein
MMPSGSLVESCVDAKLNVFQPLADRNADTGSFPQGGL